MAIKLKSSRKQIELCNWTQLINRLPFVFLVLQFTHIFGVVRYSLLMHCLYECFFLFLSYLLYRYHTLLTLMNICCYSFCTMNTIYSELRRVVLSLCFNQYVLIGLLMQNQRNNASLCFL